MSERLLKLEDAVGKTVARVADTEEFDCRSIIALFFTDDSYICISSENSYADYPDTVVYEDALSDTDELAFGLISKEEYAERKRVENEKMRAHTERYERRQLEELKRKYEIGREAK